MALNISESCLLSPVGNSEGTSMRSLVGLSFVYKVGVKDAKKKFMDNVEVTLKYQPGGEMLERCTSHATTRAH